MVKKAFKAPPPSRPLEETPKNRRYPVGPEGDPPKRSAAPKPQATRKPPPEAKRIISYKLPPSLGDRVTQKAHELRAHTNRKIWPAHVVEAALLAFLKADLAVQAKLVDEVAPKRSKRAS